MDARPTTDPVLGSGREPIVPTESTARAASRPIYCRACGYQLTGLVAEPRCPECGNPFDVSDPSTYALDPAGPAVRRTRRLGRQPAFWLVALAVPAGVINAVFLPFRPQVFVALLTAFMALAWCRLDAAERRLRLHTVYQALLFIVPYVLVPVHLLVTRRAAGFAAILVAFGALVAALLLSFGAHRVVLWLM